MKSAPGLLVYGICRPAVFSQIPAWRIMQGDYARNQYMSSESHSGVIITAITRGDMLNLKIFAAGIADKLFD